MGQKRLAQIPSADGQEQGYTIPEAKTGQPPRPDKQRGTNTPQRGSANLEMREVVLLALPTASFSSTGC